MGKICINSGVWITITKVQGLEETKDVVMVWFSLAQLCLFWLHRKVFKCKWQARLEISEETCLKLSDIPLLKEICL